MSSTGDEDLFNALIETLASNTSLNERHDYSLELDDTDNTADQNESNDDDYDDDDDDYDDDDDNDDGEKDSDNEIYVPPGSVFA